MTASPRMSGLPQLGRIQAAFLTTELRQALLWGKKKIISPHAGHRGNSFSSRK